MASINKIENNFWVITPDQVGLRLDQVLSSFYPEFSRSFLKNFILDHKISVNNLFKPPDYRLKLGDYIKSFIVIDNLNNNKNSDHIAENIALNIAYEDEDLLIINKPAGLVTHPAVGHYSGTLVNGLLYYLPQLSLLPRAGIIHRLDQGTTGLLIVAKHLIAYYKLVNLLKNRLINREYYALVVGNNLDIEHKSLNRVIESWIGRHPKDRKKMAVLDHPGKWSVTYYNVLEKFYLNKNNNKNNLALSLLKLKLETGRTHQIRVHLSHFLKPIIGDKTYGFKKINYNKNNINIELIEHINNFSRPALHAYRLSLSHPVINNKIIDCQVDLPEDFKLIINNNFINYK